MKWIFLTVVAVIVYRLIKYFFSHKKRKKGLALSLLISNLKIQTMTFTGQAGGTFKFMIDPTNAGGTIIPRNYNDGTPRLDVKTLSVASSDPNLLTLQIDPEGDGYSGSGNLVVAGSGTISFTAVNSKGTFVSGSATFTITAVEEDAAGLEVTFS